MQYLRTGRRGLAAFRRLLGRPILQNIQLQDVVFASGCCDECVDAHAAADRASVNKLSDLNAVEKKLEKLDLKAVRKGSKKRGDTAERAYGMSQCEWFKLNNFLGTALSTQV